MELDYEHIDKQLSFIDTQLFNKIVELAKVVVLSDEDIHGFCLVGGKARFSVNTQQRDLELYRLLEHAEGVRELDLILSGYNDMLKSTDKTVKIDKLPSGELSVIFDGGEPRRSPRNNIVFETYPPGSSVEDYGQIVDSLYEMARDVADANGIGYPEALQDVEEGMLETLGWVLLPTERERILERLNIQ